MGHKRSKQYDDETPASAANAEPRKRLKQYTDAHAKLADIFNRLADEVQTEREGATKELTALLSTNDTDQAQKILVRLARGLCSGRKAARFGFAVALTHILEQLYRQGKASAVAGEISVSQVIDLIRDNTQPPEGKISGQEKRDYSLGRLFGYTAVIESRIATEIADQKKLLELIFELAVKFPYLREECGKTICTYVNLIRPESSVAKEDVTTVFDQLKASGLLKTPEGVAIWLTIGLRFPDFEFPSGIWHKNDPLNKKERQNLANVLRGVTDDTSEEPTEDAANGAKKHKKMKGSPPQSTLNFAWTVVFTTIIQRQEEQHESKDKLKGSSEFTKFWVEVVDNSLFSNVASPQRKLLGFQLLSKCIATCPDWAIQSLFSPNLRRCLINQRKDSERYLHNASKASLTAMQSRASSSPDTTATIVFGLIKEEKGFVNFDKLTQSKTIENLIATASEDALLEIVQFLLDQITHIQPGETASAEALRRSVADLLMQVVRNRKEEQLKASINAEGDTWLHLLLDSFVQFAYFIPSEGTKHSVPVPPLSKNSKSVFQSRISSSLTHILSTKVDESVSIPYYVTARLRKHRKSSSGLAMALQADKQVLRTIKDAQSTVDVINVKETDAEGAQRTVLRAFKLLFCLTIIQAYNGEPDAIALLDELQACYTSTSEDASAESGAFDMLIEIILGFVAKPSALFRKSGEQAFTAFASEISLESLTSMLDILAKKETLSGQQDLFDQEAEGEEGDDVDMEDASDVEVLDASDVAEDNSEDGSENEDGDEEDEDDGEDDEELARFENLLAEALKTSKPNGADATEQDDSDDDEDMDDEEMMALEPHLTKIFQERKKISSKKKEKKDAKETMLNFKNRVLDLLSIFVKQQYASPLALRLVLPLTHLVRTTSSQQVATKTFDLLKLYFDTCRNKKITPVPEDVDELWDALRAIHAEALKGSSSKVYAHACSRSSLFVVRVLVATDRTNYAAAEAIYSASRVQWWTNTKCSLPVSFFVEWDNWSNETRRAK